jgi:prepilin-type N-terminal cleavage/methylation domain-containing protein
VGPNGWEFVARNRAAHRHVRAYRARADGGFTLVELLVVVGIIAVLIAILLPVLSRARENANRTTCLSNLRQLSISMVLYCNDNHDYFPSSGAWVRADSPTVYQEMDEDWIWWQLDRDVNQSPFARYLNVSGDKLQRLLRCPTDNVMDRQTLPGDLASGQGKYRYSYTINQAVSSGNKEVELQCTMMSKWSRTSEKILFTEEIDPNDSRYAPPGDRLTNRHGKGFKQANPVSSYPVGAACGLNINSAFVDGHAVAITQDYADDPRHYVMGEP